MKERIIRFNVEFIKRNYKLICIISTLLTLLSLYIIISKFKINSDFGDMLPRGQRSVVDQQIVKERIGSPEYIHIVLETTEKEGDFINIESLDKELNFESRIGSFSISHEGLKTFIHFILNKKPSKKFKGKEVNILIERAGKTEPVFKLNGNVVEIKDISNGNEVIIEVLDTLSRVEKTLFENVRQGDPDRDGMYEMEVAKENLHLIADAIKESPLVMDVYYRFDPEFFQNNRLLYAKVEDLEKLRCCIIEKQKQAIRKELAISEEEIEKEKEEFEEDEFYEKEEEEDPVCSKLEIDLKKCFREEETFKKYKKIENEFPQYFISDAGYLTFLVRPVKPSTDIEFNLRVQQEIKEIIMEVVIKNPQTLGKVINLDEIGLGGGYPEKLYEIKRIYSDIRNSIAFTLSLFFILLIIYFRKIRSLPLVIIPLVMGVCWTLSIFFLTIGYLNLITAFIFAILFGLGIDFGIHMLTRYIEERKRGNDIISSIYNAQKTTGIATTYTAFTTIVTFFSLIFTSFKGFSHFGMIAGTGVFFCLFTVFTIFPAFLILTEKIKPMKFKQNTIYRKNPSPFYLKRIPFPLASIILFVFFGFFLLCLTVIPNIKFEYNFRKLMAENPELEEVGTKKGGATKGLTLSPSVAIARDQREAKNAWKKLKEMNLPSIEFVAGIFDLLPEKQEIKLKIIDKIRKLIEKKRDFVEKKEDIKRVDELYELTKLEKIEIEDIPEIYLRFFRERASGLWQKIEIQNLEKIIDEIKSYLKNDEKSPVGNIIYIFPEKDLADGRYALEYSKEIEDFLVHGRQIPIGSSALVMADVIKAVQNEGPRTVGLAFFSVFFILILSFSNYSRKKIILIIVNHLGIAIFAIWLCYQNILALNYWKALFISSIISLILDIFISFDGVKKTLIVISPLFLAIIFTLATMYFFHMKLHLFNTIVFPMAIGIGIDNAIHIFHRYREEGRGFALKALRFTAPAVFMASITTIIGFSGMLFTEHKGLFSIGLLSLIAIGFCIITSIIFLPCLLTFLEIRKNKLP